MTNTNEKNIIKFLLDLEAKDYLVERDWADVNRQTPWSENKPASLDKMVFDAFNFYAVKNPVLAQNILEKAIAIDIKQHKNASLIRWRKTHSFDFGNLFFSDSDGTAVKQKFDILFNLSSQNVAYIFCKKNVYSRGSVLRYKNLANSIDLSSKSIDFISQLDSAMLQEMGKHYSEKQGGEKYDFKKNYPRDSLVSQEASATLFLRDKFLYAIATNQIGEIDTLIKDKFNHFNNDSFILKCLILCSKTGNPKLIEIISRSYEAMGRIDTTSYIHSFAHEFLSHDGVMKDILDNTSSAQKEHLLNVFYISLYEKFLYNFELEELPFLTKDFFKDIENYDLKKQNQKSVFNDDKPANITNLLFSKMQTEGVGEYIDYLTAHLPRSVLVQDFMENRIMFSILFHKNGKIKIDDVKKLLNLFPELIHTHGMVESSMAGEFKNMTGYNNGARILYTPIYLTGALMVSPNEEVANYIQHNFKLNWNELGYFYKETKTYSSTKEKDSELKFIDFIDRHCDGNIRLSCIQCALEQGAQIDNLLEFINSFLKIKFPSSQNPREKVRAKDSFIKIVGVIMNLKNSPLPKELVGMIEEYEKDPFSLSPGITITLKILGLKKGDDEYEAISANITKYYLSNAIAKGRDSQTGDKFKI